MHKYNEEIDVNVSIRIIKKFYNWDVYRIIIQDKRLKTLRVYDLDYFELVNMDGDGIVNINIVEKPKHNPDFFEYDDLIQYLKKYIERLGKRVGSTQFINMDLEHEEFEEFVNLFVESIINKCNEYFRS